jgi:hypothetical protein
VLQAALNSEMRCRDEDKAAASTTLQQQLAAKDKQLQKAAQQLAAAEQQNISLRETGKKQTADAHATALAEAAVRLSQAEQAHAKEAKQMQDLHSNLMQESAQKHQEDITAMEMEKRKVCQAQLAL